MVHTFALSIIRLVQRMCIVLTLGCLAYVIVFFFSKNQDNAMSGINMAVPTKEINLITASPSPLFSLQPLNASANVQVRDIFSLTTPTPDGAVESTPKGQLPDHLKVVGVLIAHPSQIVIEDTSLGATYFIDEGKSQDGIKVVKVGREQITVNYQGQDIPIPVTKD
jgi:hypothetical protein